jgi:RimJ/RimL family protein N-acetyltransferase
MFVRTERLLLRPGWREDAPELYRAICDEGIVRNLGSAPWPYRPEDAEAFLASERNPAHPGFLIFRRTETAPEFVGTIGLGARPGDGRTELGYWIARPHWGRGYASEAGRGMLRLARDGLRLRKLTAGHFIDNPASGRVLEKLGFRRTGAIAERFSTGRGSAAPCALYELDLSGEADGDAPLALVAERMAA